MTTKIAITDPQFGQCWTLDATSNWTEFRQDNDGTGWSPVNEITDITNTTGPTWITPAYDRNGNMNVLPQGADPTQSYNATYDAWNRLVKLIDGEDIVQENQYDARNFRTIRKDYTDGTLSETRHFYYTDSWQDIEERLGTSADPEQQNIWGIRYIDDLFLRDRTTPDPLDERLYA